MTTTDLLALLWRSTLVTSLAIACVLALRLPARRLLGARAAYLLWAIVPVAALAGWLPAPTHPIAPALQVLPSMIEAQPAIELQAGAEVAPRLDLRGWLLAGWSLGALAALALFVGQQRRYLRSLGRLEDAGGGALRAQREHGSPALVGALRPRIVLPPDFNHRFDARERDLVIAHERAHLVRGDAQVNALVALLRCLQWFNPLVHFAATRLRVDQEIACDAIVIAQFPEARRPYADAMLKAQLVGEARQELRLPAGCYWPSTHPLKERISMLKHPIQRPRQRALAYAVAVVFALGAGYASWAAQPGAPAAGLLRAASAGATASDEKIAARLVLSVNGKQVLDTLNIEHGQHDATGWNVETTSDEAYVSGSAAHLSAVNVVRRDGSFGVSATRGGETWSIDGAAKRIDADRIEFLGTVKHNGAVVSEPRLLLRVGEPGAVEVGSDASRVRLDITLRPWTSEPPTPEQVAAAKASAALAKASGKPAQLMPPVQESAPSENIAFRKMYPPKYPAEAVKNRISGKVVLKVHMDATGTPLSADVVSVEPASASLLSDSAIAAAMSWRYTPGMEGGKAVGGDVLIPVDYSLRDMDDDQPMAALAADGQAASYRRLKPPAYPPQALADHVDGVVLVRAHIDAKGQVANADLEWASSPAVRALGQSAIDAVSGWTFNAATRGGAAVESDVLVPIEFAIDGVARGKVTLPPTPAGTTQLERIRVQGTVS